MFYCSTQPYANDVQISTCGWSPIPNDETFTKHLVLFSDICNNPTLLESPNLVVRIKDKYYNWKVAVPIIISITLYQRSLPQVNNIVLFLMVVLLFHITKLIDTTNILFVITHQEFIFDIANDTIHIFIYIIINTLFY